MTVCSISPFSAILTTAVFLSACNGSTPDADHILSLPEAIQRQAHLDCQAEQGLNIPEALNVLKLNDGRVVVSVVNGPGLPLAQARTINQCARGKLLGRQTPAYPATPAVTPRPASAPQYVKHTDFTSGAPAGCVRGGGTLQSGTLICPGY